MKYIRTKDGRIIDLDRVVYGYKVIHLKGNEIEGCHWAGWYWYSEEYGHEMECRDADIVKQADTIEELCDEFVDIDNHDYYKIAHKDGITFALSKTKRFIGNYDIRLKKYIGQIMGAIYTDKGLIYVAKMNEKGELELL